MVNNLYTSAHGAYLAPAVVALYSAARKTEVPLKCTLVTDASLSGLDVDGLRSLFREQNAKLEFFDWTKVETGILPSIQARFRNSSLAMAWMFVDQIFPIETSRAVYVDSDTMALGSIADLFDLELGEDCTAAVFDYAMLPKRPMTDGARALERAASNRRFNSGVLVQDISCYREQGVARACVDYLNSGPASIDNFADQDTLNVVCRGKIREMSPIYN